VYLPAANTLEFAANSLAQYRIAPLGVFSWYDGAGGTRMTLNSTALGVGVAPVAGRGAVQLSAGVGFPATQVASTDVNTLDDYEEGTFTPTIVGGTAAGVGVYTTQKGNYTKVGNLVYFNIYVVWTAHTGTGSISVGGLPFTSNATSGRISSVTFGGTTIALTASNVIRGYIDNNSSLIAVTQYPVGGGANTSVSMDPSTYFIVSGSYMV